MEIRKFVNYSLGLEIYTYERTISALDAFFIVYGSRVIYSFNTYIGHNGAHSTVKNIIRST